MKNKSLARHSLEILEQRIAPAALLNEAGFKTAAVGTPLLLQAGQGLSTGGPNAGTYLLYVEKGQALVFTTDYNLNNAVDYNEITGIAAGDGLRMISFVDIHGDIVTNLKPDTSLSDSDRNSINDDPFLGGDGKVLLNSTIEKIELRSLTVNDIGDQDGIGTVGTDGKIIPDQNDVDLRLALSSYSIHGNILAGKGFGLANDPTSGLLIDTTGKAEQQTFFVGGDGTSYHQTDFFVDFKPTIGSIKTGTAATGTYFTFGAARPDGTTVPGNPSIPAYGVAHGDDVQGRIVPYVPVVNQTGGDISYVRASDTNTTFNIDSLETGNGGLNARGGNISNVQLSGDDAGGYRILAGDGGRGVNGGVGGAIINLSDFSSVTGHVVIKTGDGGVASTGAGGNGGNLSFGTMNLAGDIQITLGSGGDGFKAGGNGSALTQGTFTTPQGAVQFGVNVVATSGTSTPGTLGAQVKVGTSIPVDFDENGLGDFLFTSDDPNQLVVMLDGIGTRISLDGPVNAEAVVVADFNDDGHQDIAAASSDPGDFAGISVFLSKYEDINGDGNLTASEDLNHNGSDDFLGFYGPIHSTLPALDNRFPSFPVPSVLTGATPIYHRSAVSIGDMVAGDFNGDGRNELAVMSTYYSGKDNVPIQVLQYLTPDVEYDSVRGVVAATGQFYVDVGIKAPAGGSPTVYSPFVALAGGVAGSVIIKGTRLDTNAVGAAAHDVILSSPIGAKSISTFDYSSPNLIGPASIGTWDFDKDNGHGVDVDRLLPAGSSPHIDSQTATVADFTILDEDGDGKADIAVLTAGPSPDFIIGVYGTGTGGQDNSRVRYSDAPSATPGVGDLQNAGIALAKVTGTTVGIGSPFTGIVTTDADGDGDYDDIALLHMTATKESIEELVFVPRANPGATGATSTKIPDAVNAQDLTVVAFDAYTYNIAGAPSDIGYAVAVPTKAANSRLSIDLLNVTAFGGVPISIPIALNGLDITAGDGGDALVGKGGTGGGIGGKIGFDSSTGVVDGALDITFPANLAQDIVANFTGGDGGNGFSTGGKGGSVTGLYVRTLGPLGHSTVGLFAGDGGFGVSGAGGAGGDLAGNSVQDGLDFEAGNGGRGLTGGTGGAVLGNGLSNIFDTSVGDLIVIAGNGGAGVKAGGTGGVIADFHASYNVGDGSLFYQAGAGGSAISGAGGSGGSITNSSTVFSVNLLLGEVQLYAGDGGSGKSGGAGGSIVSFANRPSVSENPVGTSFVAGDGGAGGAGNGGAGGAIRDIFAPSKGQGLYGFNRIISGNGGNSASGTGGAGGTISDLKQVGATDGSLAIAAGAGGNGLRAGGIGGSVLNSKTSVGGSAASKLLVIAGKGGDVSTVVFNPNDGSPNLGQKVFGGKMGRAGDGGSIVNLAQELGVAARVDLIAGNGGSTINFGTISPKEKSFVGTGGSVSNIIAVGNIGNIDPAVKLKSYNDTRDLNADGLPDQTIAQFVSVSLRDFPSQLDDSLGNVGIIVGAAGNLKTIQTGTNGAGPVFTTQPSGSALNGNLTDVNARNLLSAVAGSIDRIAAIQLVTGLKIGFQPSGGGAFSQGIVGADKNTVGAFEYFKQDGTIVTAPILDGRLTDPTPGPGRPIGDGAVVARKLVIKAGDPNLVGRVFVG